MRRSLRWPKVMFIAAMCWADVHGAIMDFGRLDKVSGDRQILVGPPLAAIPLAPLTIVVRDEEGRPLADVVVYIKSTASELPCPWLRDEFGFYGFNGVFPLASCSPVNSSFAGVSGVEGIVAKAPANVQLTPSAFLYGAAAQVPTGVSRPEHAVRQFFTIIRAEKAPPGNPSVVVEYFHETFRHYFNTVLQPEIDGLDRGVFPGWTRSVGGFIAWATAADAPPGAVSVCRFFSSKFTSHFYTADPIECDEVVERFGDEWQLETREAYYIYRPDKSTGACIEGTMPVYRVYAGATRTPNHRYVTDRALRDAMVSQGWIAEGYGPDAVIMCTPR